MVHPSWVSVEVTNFCLPLSWAFCVSLCFEKPKYTGMQMAISKVQKEQTFLGVIPRSSTPVIQIVLIHEGTGVQTSSTVEQLAADIMEDIAQHGNTAVLALSLQLSPFSLNQFFLIFKLNLPYFNLCPLLLALSLPGSALQLCAPGQSRGKGHLP